jgi:hypothetical protein
MHQHECNNMCLALGLILTQQKLLFPMFECSHNYIIKSIHAISKDCFRVCCHFMVVAGGFNHEIGPSVTKFMTAFML